jgi:serine/threonine protein kinase
MASDGATATAVKSGAPDPLIGRVIAERFRIVSLIARGGMGKVYVAEQLPLGRSCAIKVLNPNYNGDADPEFHRRFFREASITSRITHPNSVTIFDYGKTDDDVYYMAMELLEGQTLHHALRDAGTMHEDRVGRISQQICRALREAHTLDVIHRDLKPANIFLSKHGDDEDYVKVLDFGLVKHLTERPEEQLTQTGLFMGSPKYMAPEQIQGGHVDARTDVYSLGIMMYEMLAGKVPFERPTSVNILMAHVGEPPPPMREVNPNLVCSPAFEELVMRCIAKDPAERYTTMDAVLQAIKRAHGVSMTGQLAAVNTSGSFMPIPSDMPPPVRSSVPGFAGNSPAAGARSPFGVSGVNSVSVTSTSGSHAPLAMLRADGTGDSGVGAYAESRAPRSKAWIVVGVLGAALLGGLLGLGVFRMTTNSATTQGPSTSTSTSAPSAAGAASAEAPAPSATGVAGATGAGAGVASGAAVDARSVTFKVTTDPPGASVREDATELCASTPCDVTFKGDAADPAKTHKLLVQRVGFRPELKVVKPGDASLSSGVHVRLFRGGGVGGGRPAVAPPATGAKPAETTPNGFKDLPY